MTNSFNDKKGDEYIRFGKNVMKARQEKGISQKEINRIVGVVNYGSDEKWKKRKISEGF